ncbi:hypothetical protein GCM10009133_15720 [Cocleimonas flava]|uniref:Rap1a immunity protein domain-containing protein n=1 Tax=Cocleimonas flava TaxID=634765 RepID=A0A4R1F2C9_9GAMM|nr:Rap1a/Tai family immunity protein [Cocleimonas flava]TCJ84501.1 hypothetical protein EV695_2458 [Cocleimonas flava]
MKQSLLGVSLLSLLLFLLLSSTTVSAVESLTTEELAAHCSHYEKDPQGVDAVFCIRYIQGFIDGAVATDELVVSNIVTGKEKETFSERAARTRLGKLRLYGSTYVADFCLNDPVKLNQVVTKIVTELATRKQLKEPPLARDLVYHTLVTNYPCEKKRL